MPALTLRPMKRHIPNAITLLNLLSGAFGVVFSLNGYWYMAFWLMIAAAVFDFFDGLAARALKVTSSVGKELDSLSDLISFGMLPGAIMYRMLFSAYNLPDIRLAGAVNIIPFAGLLITAASALRLAKFNVDTRQSEIFIGLPTPANALLIGGVSLITHFACHCTPVGHFAGSVYTLLGLTIFSTLMPVVELPMLSLKFKNLKFKANIWRWLLIAGSIVIVIMFIYWVYMAVSLIILYYIALSVVWNVFNALKSKTGK